MAKQKRLPGVDDPVIQEIEDAATEYENARDVRVEATKPEVKTKTRLIEIMMSNKRKSYRRGDLVIKVRAKDPKPTVSVKRKKRKTVEV